MKYEIYIYTKVKNIEKWKIQTRIDDMEGLFNAQLISTQ